MPQARPAPRSSGTGTDHLLRSHLPELVLERLRTRDGPEPPGTDHRFGATALFADISGFTTMSEALAAAGRGGTEELTDLLNDFFGAIVGAIDAAGGSVMTFGGDAVTAVFPARGRARRAALRAVRCADAMQSRMTDYRSIATSAGAFSLAFKAGLAAGPVLLTTVGHEHLRFDPVIAGPAIDGAVAAEHRAAAGHVVLHPSIAALVDAIDGEPLGDGWLDVRSIAAARAPARRRARGAPRSPSAATVRAYLHPAIAAAIETGHASYLNEHRRVAAVFTAFDGPDPMSPGAGAELQRVLAPAFHAIEETGGHLVQVDTGDKGHTCITVFGAPIAHGDDERRALAFAMRAREVVPGARSGVCSGDLFAGEVGGDARRTYTTIGDAMNVAARLMQQAKRDEVLAAGIPDDTLRAVAAIEELPPRRMKGRVEPVRFVRVLAPADRAGATTAPEPRNLVGRGRERARLRRRLDAAGAGRARAAVLVGAPGVGKTALLDDAMSNALDRGFDVHAGACVSTGTQTPYLGIRGVVASLLDVGHGSPGTRRRRLRDSLGSIDRTFVLRAPLLGPVLDLSIPETSATRGLDGALRAELLHGLVLDLVRDRASRRPVAIFLEDIQWLDPASALLIGTLARSLAHDRIALVMSSRTTEDASSGLAEIPTLEHIDLGPLDVAHLKRLARAEVRQTFGAIRPASTVLDLIVERADGNPLFLQETVHLLRDRGVAIDDPSTGAIGDLPATVHQLLVARIDGLSPTSRTLLLQASVLGVAFDASWVWGSFADVGSPANVRRGLADLRRADLLAAGSSRDRRAVRFRHATIREAAYETLSHARRRDLHARVGRFLERTHRDDLDTVAEVLAQHFGETRLTAEQRRYFALAARKARSAFQHDAAITWFRRLVTVAVAGERAGVHRETGEVEQLAGRWSEAVTSFASARREAERAANVVEAARTAAALGHLQTYRGHAEEARALLESALEPLTAADDTEWIARTLEYLAFVTAQASDLDASLAYSRRQMELAERTGDRLSASMAYEQTGLALWHRGEYVEAGRALERALREADAAGSVRGVVLAANDLAGLWHERSQHLRAFRFVRRALAGARTMGYRHAIGVLVGNAGELYRVNGEPGRGLRYAAAGLEVTSDLRDWPDVAAKLVNIGHCLLDVGRDREAARSTELASAFAAATTDPYLGCEATLLSAGIASARGMPRRAIRLTEQARTIAETIERRDVLVAATILSLQLRHIDGPEAAITLDGLSSPDAPVEASIELDAARWALAGDEAARHRSTRALRTEVRRAPTAEHRRLLAELTGEVVPTPDPLPPLEDVDPPEPALGSLFRRTRALLGEIEPDDATARRRTTP